MTYNYSVIQVLGSSKIAEQFIDFVLCIMVFSCIDTLHLVGFFFTTLPCQCERAHAILGIRIGGCQFEAAVILEDQEESGEWSPAEVCNVVAQKGIDHPQNGRLPYPVLAMQKRDAVVQVEIDTMVVNPEQTIDFDTF